MTPAETISPANQSTPADYRARYYSENDARFMSPDWSAKVEPVPYAKLDNPQSLNLYSYVLDNPLSGVDSNGHKVQGKKHHKKAQQQNGSSNPNGSVPAPPPGKGENWKPGDPLTPNEWVPARASGNGKRTGKWKPKYPVPGQSQPGVSWDPAGHWDYDPGVKGGGRTRWLPNGGGQVDHFGNPIRMTISPQTVRTAAKVGFWGAAGAITIRIAIGLGEAASAF